MKYKVFIDGESGTTGLKIRSMLGNRIDSDLITIPEGKRKDCSARSEAMHASDVVILCLPDDAAKEALSLVKNSKVRIIDSSTAHRVSPGWVYGFPEMGTKQRAAIKAATRVANPGCLATGVIAILRPLIKSGMIPHDYPVTVNSSSGYTGGGKTLISEFETEGAGDAFRIYGLQLTHKHLPEIMSYLNRPGFPGGYLV